MHPNPSDVDPAHPPTHPNHSPAVAQQSALFANPARQRPPAHVLPPHLRNLSSQQLSAAMRNNHPALLARHMRREDPRRALSLQITPNSLQLDTSLTNPLASDLMVDNSIDNVLPPTPTARTDPAAAQVVAVAAAAAAEAAAANNPRNPLSHMQPRVLASTPTPMRAPTPPSTKSRAYALQPGLSSDAASSASRRGPIDHNSAQRPYDCAVQDDSQPRPNNPNATSSMLSRKRTAHHLPPKSPATSPNDNASSRLQFSAPDSAGPVKRRRSLSGYGPSSSVSPRVAHPLSQQQQRQHSRQQQQQQQQPQQPSQQQQQQSQQAQQQQQQQQQQQRQQQRQQQQQQRQQASHHHQQQSQQQQQPQQQPNQQQQPQSQQQAQQHQQIQQQIQAQPNASQQISPIDLQNFSKGQPQQPSIPPQQSQQLLLRQRQIAARAVAAGRNDQRYLGHGAAGRNGMRLTPRSSPLANPLAFQAQDAPKRRDSFSAGHAASRNPAHVIDHDSAKMNVDSNSLQTAFRMGDASLAMSQPLQAHSQALPNASASRVSASPGFVMPNNQISLDMSTQGFPYLSCMDGKDVAGILAQNSIAVSGVTTAVPNMGNPASIGVIPKKTPSGSRAQSRSNKTDKGIVSQNRTGSEKPSEDMPISERLQRNAQRLRDGTAQKENVDALSKMKPEPSSSHQPGANVQSSSAKNAMSNHSGKSLDTKDASRARLGHESTKAKTNIGLPPSGSMPSALASGMNVAVKGKVVDDIETESRSTKSDRHPPINRASTPSQKSTASGGSNAVERRASQGSGTSKRARARTKARSSGGGKRSRAERGQVARNNVSRNNVAAQTPRPTVTDVKNASSVNAKMKAVSRNVQVDRSSPLIHVNSVMAARADPSQSSDKRKQGKNDGNAKARTPVSRQSAVKEPKAKLTFETGAEKTNEQTGHDPQHGRQSPNALTASGPAQLFDMLQSSSGGARSIDNAGLDHVDGMSQFGIVTGGHNGKVNGGTGANYPYELQPFLSAGVEEEPMLGNIGSMLNNMQDAVDLGSTDFEDDSLLGPADPGDLIGRNRA
ncbi:ribosomal protein L19 [Gracilaria domingensis]|nr:ribosomal protein L19 [Gracilaria domingensis]